jgi:Transglycosylase SLT domain
MGKVRLSFIRKTRLELGNRNLPATMHRTAVSRTFRITLQATVMVCLVALDGLAGQAKEPDFRLAAAFELPKIPGVSGGAADWRQWDAFFTFVVKRFGQDVSGDLKDSLGAAFLDLRYELNNAIAPGKGGNPVPDLFLNAWTRLSPIMNKALPGLPKQTASQYASFISAADKLTPLGKAGSQLGVLQLSPDALRGMARILEPTGAADPLAFNTSVDSGLRSLLGFGSPLTTPRPSTKQSRLREHLLSPEVQHVFAPGYWFVTPAIAADSSASKLNEWVPEGKDLQDYLKQVRDLLVALTDRIAAKSNMNADHKLLYRQIVFTAAWQESCWRQYIRKGKSITPLLSSTGDLGLMQVNRNTWRGVYDLKRLSGDIEYNSNAGGEILDYYLMRHAIRKNENKQPGGHLARATYSAYNGGPGAVGRYRSAKAIPALKKVDEAFWDKFQAVSFGRELEVQRCYQN